MQSSKYGVFRNRTQVNSEIAVSKTAEFIEKSASSVEALRESTNTNIKAVIISEQKEGADEMILFTYASEDVQVGEYITYNDKTYLIYSEYKIIFSDQFKKHKLLECNITLKWGTNVQKAYYISSLRKYAALNDLSATSIAYEFSSQKPIVVTKENSNIKAGTRFITGGEPYVVRDIDKLSNQGIYYLSVEKTTVFPDIDDVPNEITVAVPAKEVELLPTDIIAGEQVTISTNHGYAVFSMDVNIISKSSTSVVFEAPFGVEKLTVQTKTPTYDIVSTEYRIVI